MRDMKDLGMVFRICLDAVRVVRSAVRKLWRNYSEAVVIISVELRADGGRLNVS